MTDYLNTTHHTVAWLRNASNDGTLDVAPPFQRNPVWTDNQKAFLIDSLLRGFPVPEIYIQDSVDEHGNELHVVVDGQQRIRACLDFLDGRFPLLEEHTPEFADMTFDSLPGDAKKRVFQYKFVVRLLPAMPQTELRAIFGRLNRNVVALNAQELRHATYWGPFIRQMERLADDTYWSGTGIFSPNDVRRMLDVEFISELTVAALHGPQTKKASLERWYEIYEENYEEERRVDEIFRTVLREVDVILPAIRETRWRKKSDFYTLFALLAARRAYLPLTREQRDLARKNLLEFGVQVDEFVSDPDATASTSAKRYAAAVERAATDVANRRVRLRELDELLRELWPDAERLVASRDREPSSASEESAAQADTVSSEGEEVAAADTTVGEVVEESAEDPEGRAESHDSG